jgi:hypothetical protein
LKLAFLAYSLLVLALRFLLSRTIRPPWSAPVGYAGAPSGEILPSAIHW